MVPLQIECPAALLGGGDAGAENREELTIYTILTSDIVRRNDPPSPLIRVAQRPDFADRPAAEALRDHMDGRWPLAGRSLTSGLR